MPDAREEAPRLRTVESLLNRDGRIEARVPYRTAPGSPYRFELAVDGGSAQLALPRGFVVDGADLSGASVSIAASLLRFADSETGTIPLTRRPGETVTVSWEGGGREVPVEDFALAADRSALAAWAHETGIPSGQVSSVSEAFAAYSPARGSELAEWTRTARQTAAEREAAAIAAAIDERRAAAVADIAGQLRRHGGPMESEAYRAAMLPAAAALAGVEADAGPERIMDGLAAQIAHAELSEGPGSASFDALSAITGTGAASRTASSLVSGLEEDPSSPGYASAVSAARMVVGEQRLRSSFDGLMSAVYANAERGDAELAADALEDGAANRQLADFAEDVAARRFDADWADYASGSPTVELQIAIAA